MPRHADAAGYEVVTAPLMFAAPFTPAGKKQPFATAAVELYRMFSTCAVERLNTMPLASAGVMLAMVVSVTVSGWSWSLLPSSASRRSEIAFALASRGDPLAAPCWYSVVRIRPA